MTWTGFVDNNTAHRPFGRWAVRYINLPLHDLQHDSCAQAEAVFEQQALGYRLQLALAFGAAGEEGFLLVVQGAEELFLVAAEQAEGFRVLTAGRAAVLRRLDIAVPELLQDTRVFHFLHLVFSKNVRHTEVPNGVVMV